MGIGWKSSPFVPLSLSLQATYDLLHSTCCTRGITRIRGERGFLDD